MHNLSLEFSADNSRTGFRLERLEVLNWGTFGNRAIWKIEPGGANSLLTGDIGSGKSTLVDAVTTLLVPHQKIVYNRAAGVEARERTIKSYVLGEYKNIKSEYDNRAQAACLRDDGEYTVLLASFLNEGYNQKTVLAQVFWLRSDKPEKFFVVSGLELSIAEHFTKFGKDILQLKKRLKGLDRTQVFENFTDYCTSFRNLFGIRSEKALELFYQTVSIKSVGNLTEFVRNHMIEKSDVKEKIEELKRNYENLTRSHEAVRKAKKQVEELQPLARDAENFEAASAEVRSLQGSLEALPSFFASRKAELLQRAIREFSEQTAIAENRLKEVKRELDGLRDQAEDVSAAIRNNAEGRRIEELEREIRNLEVTRTGKQAKADEYDRLATALGLPAAPKEEAFYQSLKQAGELREAAAAESSELIEHRDGLKINLSGLGETVSANERELESLRRRKTQIPEANLKIRETLARDLEIPEQELPFSGELLKVKDEESAWEGAVERVLHNFGLSVFVPEEHYKRVSVYVDRTNLKGRIVYFKVPATGKYEEARQVSAASLANKVEIKSGTPFFDWLEHELRESFNYECCETIEQFQREPRALTKSGQIKGGKARHEKDDRRSILDRKSYILGWSNREKIKAIEKELVGLGRAAEKVEQEIRAVEEQQRKLKEREANLRDLVKITDYSEINWKKDALETERLLSEKEALEKSSDQLQALKNRLAGLRGEIGQKDAEREIKEKKLGKLEESTRRAEEELGACGQIAGMITDAERTSFFPAITEQVQDKEFSLSTIDRLQTETRKGFENRRNRKTEEEKKLRDTIISRMQKYKNAYPEETVETDAAVEAITEFKGFLKKLEDEDLPKHEKRFKELLNEGTINDIAIFKNQLENSAKDIEDKIKQINRSLREIEYNPGTFIILIADKTADTDVRDFQVQLRNCLENMAGDTELYNEEKFGRVKLILDRLGSAAQAELNWTSRVTDVRNWFAFSASERYSEDNAEKEFYSDSSGKSGGQKEKLAYTILASALAYQFGLEWKQTRSRSFRFVALDEAFGRSSDDSTRYALELFKKLDLQLLLVTPLQKINIIENYINAVHFVANDGGNNSVVRDLTIQEYREEKARYLGRAEAAQ
ncbi:MAG: ATP-dependent exonuclease SbcCD, C subunit-like protein [Nitrospirota bacterium]|nr:ATP-dependent exonuclease SbcCD, C subunit-like protein [Nitrospirota bacterium]